jgi:hypothetical protein
MLLEAAAGTGGIVVCAAAGPELNAWPLAWAANGVALCIAGADASLAWVARAGWDGCGIEEPPLPLFPFRSDAYSAAICGVLNGGVAVDCPPPLAAAWGKGALSGPKRKSMKLLVGCCA